MHEHMTHQMHTFIQYFIIINIVTLHTCTHHHIHIYVHRHKLSSSNIYPIKELTSNHLAQLTFETSNHLRLGNPHFINI